jgi:predicted nucleotidyltransferase component of viral defense system
MTIKIIEERIKEYRPVNQLEELNAFKEIVQELTLFALSRSNFFHNAAFQGGTALRILYALPRFSEDLDFSLIKPNADFTWKPFLTEIQLEFEAYGLQLEVQDRTNTDQAVRKAFLKENSFGRILTLTYQRTRSNVKVVRIKLEIDTDPPSGAEYKPHVIPFPVAFSITAHDLPSLFAGKLNALLTREFVKGRDWFDLLWYLSKDIRVNTPYLASALAQFDYPHLGKKSIDAEWIKNELLRVIEKIDWNMARKDLSQLLREKDLQTLDLWNKKFFQENVILLDSKKVH